MLRKENAPLGNMLPQDGYNGSEGERFIDRGGEMGFWGFRDIVGAMDLPQALTVPLKPDL